MCFEVLWFVRCGLVGFCDCFSFAAFVPFFVVFFVIL